MASLAIRRSVVTAMTAKQRRLLRVVASVLELGDPADFTAPPNTRWLVWDDDRLDLVDLAAVGTLGRLLAQSDGAVIEPADGQPPRAALREWIKANWRPDPPPASDPNPWQWVLSNNGAPAAMQAASSVPSAWSPTVVP